MYCAPVGAVCLRIPSLGVAFDGCVKLAPCSGAAFTGSGHLVYGDGDAYIGEFSSGMRHGWGEILRADGSKVGCFWAKDEPAVADDTSFCAGEAQRLAQLQRSLDNWISSILAAASVTPLSSEDMRARVEACDISPPAAPPAIADAALTSSKCAKEAEVRLIQSMSSELASLRKSISDSQSLSNSFEIQRGELASAALQLRHAQAMQGTLQAALDSTDQRLQAALDALKEAQAREQKLIQDVSAATAECAAIKSQLLHHQHLLSAAQDSVAAQKAQVRARRSSVRLGRI